MKIPPYQKRSFVPEVIDLTDTSALAPLFEKLKQTLTQAESVADLEAFLQDYQELGDALDQSEAVAYIQMTCQTDSPDRKAAYMKIVEEIDPWLKPRRVELLRMLVEKPSFNDLPEYYQIFARDTRTELELYREANVPRETELSRLSTQYQEVCGAMTVDFEGEERTLTQMGRILEETDRNRRQQAFELVAARRLQDEDRLDGIFDQMVKLRHAIAQEAGFDNYRDYMFRKKLRFDYTPEDCFAFHDAVERHLKPLVIKSQQERAAKLGVDPLRPWDLAVDPDGLEPLHPFKEADDLFAKSQDIFQNLDPRLAELFQVLADHDVVDLANRKGKAPGGYQHTLAESRLPFIFMNAVGTQSDVITLAHEAGHAFHALLARNEALSYYRHAPIEFCEVASMAMELMTAPGWGVFYENADNLARARHDHLIERVLKVFPWIATVDAFQHWIYTNPNHSRQERAAQWLSLLDRFGGIEDWSGFEKNRAASWHRQLHIFEVPFYYIEYGIAQLGALQLWRNWRANPDKAIDDYLNALSLGGSRPLPELYSAAGIRFDFTDETIVPLVGEIEREAAALRS